MYVSNLKKMNYQEKCWLDFMKFYFLKEMNCMQSIDKRNTIWSIHERILKDFPTTTNSLGAYHRHLNSKVERKKKEFIKSNFKY